MECLWRDKTALCVILSPGLSRQARERNNSAADGLDLPPDASGEVDRAGRVAMQQDASRPHRQWLAGVGDNLAAAEHAPHALDHGAFVMDHRGRELAWNEQAVIVVCAVGEEGGRNLQAAVGG